MARAKHEEPAVAAVPAEQAAAEETSAPAEAAAAQTPAAPAAPATVCARVLTYCDLGKPNDVIEIDAELAKARADVVDTDPAAVAYALTQAG